MSFTKAPVEFHTTPIYLTATSKYEVKLKGFLFMPNKASEKNKVPGIVMAHGFSATMDMDLPFFAEIFAKAGFAVLIYDHRNTGASEGFYRQDIDPIEQVEGYRDAITFMGRQKEVDKERIGIWGTSYAGGHVLQVAAIDRRVKCVVSQVPLTNGLDLLRRLLRADFRQGQIDFFNLEREKRYDGLTPTMLPVVGSADAVLPVKEADDYFKQFAGYVNSVTVTSVERFVNFFPAAYVSQIAPTPLMMIVMESDDLTPIDLCWDAFKTARGSKNKFVSFPGEHFQVYDSKKTAPKAAEAARDWFLEYL